MHSSNHIIKFADDTTVVGLINKNDESAYREEVQRLTDWCRTNNLSLNIDKAKEMVVDFRRTRRDHSPLHIDGSTVEIVKSTKFLGVHLAEDLTWSLNTSTITKKAQQHLYFLRRVRKAHLPPPILTTFYRGTIESILSSCITAWFGNCTASDRKSLQRVVRTAENVSVTWLRTYSENMTLSSTETSKVTMRSSSHGWTEVCSAVFSSVTVQDSGMYYCAVVQGKFAHIGNGSKVIVKDPTVSPVIEAISPVSTSSSEGSLQCLVTGVLPAQVEVYWMIDGKRVMGHTHFALSKVTINQLLLSSKEWQSQPACVCVVEYGREVFSKTLQLPDSCSACCVAGLLYVALASVSGLFFFMIIIIKLALYIRNKQR
ncbi:hypothetical protein NFI96_028208 [Prochilodus magdalenae]|nr:hypothetical protein NFI96_028208 [Prochilodus magdalenae]